MDFSVSNVLTVTREQSVSEGSTSFDINRVGNGSVCADLQLFSEGD